MAISKKLRQQVYEKYSGRCAYTGKPLGDKWQIDHMKSKQRHFYWYTGEKEYTAYKKEVDSIENLAPTFGIINHYKRSRDLETFRIFMMSFHNRLAKLQKKTLVEKTRKRKEYLYAVAELFDITPDKPFCGKFYFERINTKEVNNE